MELTPIAVSSPARAYVPGDDAIDAAGGLRERFALDALARGRSGSRGFLSRIASVGKRSPKATRDDGDDDDLPHSPKSPVGEATLMDALTCAGAPLTTSMLRLSSDHQAKSVKLNAVLSTLVNEHEDMNSEDFASAVQKMAKEVIKREELADEMYAQLIRATRSTVGERSRRKAWELLRIFAALFAPSRDFIGFISEYMNEVASRGVVDVQPLARAALHTMKRTSKSAMRRHAPSAEEIVAFAKNEELRVVISFLDGTFEDLPYDMTTTVKEAVEELASVIKLQNHASFSLFTVRKFFGKITSSGKDGLLSEEHRDVGDGGFVSDALGDIRKMKTDATPSKANAVTTGVLFKKRMFRESDETIDEPTFVLLSYVQAKHDFIMGNYPLSRDDAALLAALQVQADEGPTLVEDVATLSMTLGKYLPRVMCNARSPSDWAEHIARQHVPVKGLSSDEARLALLRMVRSLPYGNSTFFPARRVDDPIGLLPGKLIIGINKRGVHFFREQPMEYLYTADLRDIMQFGSAPHAIFFKMRVSGALHVFQFETKEGESVCMALQTHINDVMMKKLADRNAVTPAKDATAMDASSRGEAVNSTSDAALAAASNEAFANQAKAGDSVSTQRQIRDLTHKLEQANAERTALMAQLGDINEAFHEANDRLEAERSAKMDIAAMMKSLEQQLRDERNAAPARADAVADRLGDLSSIQIKELQDELDIETKRARDGEAQLFELQQTVAVLEQKAKRTEATNADELARVSAEKQAEISEMKDLYNASEATVGELKREIDALRSAQDEQKAALTEEMMKELNDLRELKAHFASQESTTRELMASQAEKIKELEEKYSQEVLLRRRYFNMLEDMKGKIRVYARTRPLTGIESSQNQKAVLAMPDEFTCAHPWRGEKKDRSYQFDECFPATSSQEQVFEDTKYLVQSAMDGYNVCIFAYGQTGSGKTFTIYGDDENPGLTPRAMREVMRCIHRDSGKCSVKMECYMLELYRDELIDLLRPQGAGDAPKLDIKKDTKGWVTVPNATVTEVSNEDDILDVIQTGLKVRKTAGTKMNVESSRSHLIFSLIIETTDSQTGTITKGKLSFVDLAGSERVKKSGAEGDTLKEAQAINKSLSALGDVISALASEQPHIPYRNHKLTMLLSDSIGGNCKTLMFVNVSPTDGNIEETQNSLTYATRVRTIKNDNGKNVITKEVQVLRQQLAHWKQKAGQAQEQDTVEICDEIQVEDFKNKIAL